jgi:hypothetical protein
MPTDVRVHDLVEFSAREAARLKESGCAREEHFDIVPFLQFFKDGDLIGTFFARQIDRDQALAAIQMVTPLVGADLVCATLDAHVTQSMVNPATGKPWGPHEMQNACDDEGACATGLLTDCLATMGVFRDGHVEQVNHRYTGHETIGTLKWQDPDYMVESAEGKANLSGLVVDTMKHAMTQAHSAERFTRTAEMLAKAKEVGIPPLEAYWHEVIVAAKIVLLTGACAAALLNPPNEEMRDLCATHLNEEELDKAAQGPLGIMAQLLRVQYNIA